MKSIWTYEDAEYLERCWLLLADIYIQGSKFDLATELIKVFKKELLILVCELIKRYFISYRKCCSTTNPVPRPMST
jgi:hypothetical protein